MTTTTNTSGPVFNSDVSKGSVRPGLKTGQSDEFTLIMPLKPLLDS